MNILDKTAKDFEDYIKTYKESLNKALSTLDKLEEAISVTHCCESDSEQLHTEVFELANKLAINGYSNEAVKMHGICNVWYKVRLSHN